MNTVSAGSFLFFFFHLASKPHRSSRHIKVHSITPSPDTQETHHYNYTRLGGTLRKQYYHTDDKRQTQFTHVRQQLSFSTYCTSVNQYTQTQQQLHQCTEIGHVEISFLKSCLKKQLDTFTIKQKFSFTSFRNTGEGGG